MMDERLKSNLALWNEMVPIHAKVASYRLDEFKAGASKLSDLEVQEVGEVSGKSLLHLQCHFGLDTMSWARLGAKVTGVDFSDQAVALARSLSAELKIPATFVCSDLYAAPQVLSGLFDIVFTSYGALCWLPDLMPWGEIIAHYLKPGGFFYVVDIHPFAHIFRNEPHIRQLSFESSYFNTAMFEYPPEADYADSTVKLENPSRVWIHTFESIVGSLLSAGLRIDFLHEFPGCRYQFFNFCEQDADGQWRIKGDPIPLMFSLKATKPS
jgi:SAM-dependent methyltransferase